jgi:hypothetical protein
MFDDGSADLRDRKPKLKLSAFRVEEVEDPETLPGARVAMDELDGLPG